MTRFIDVNTLTSMLRQTGTRAFFEGMLASLTEDFVRWEEFDKCARVASHSDIGVIELMPIADADNYGFKYVNGHPGNTGRGLSTVMAFGALADVHTGYPVLLSELTLTTAFRTAATSVLAASKLARTDARSMGMIGCGAQSEFQALAFHFLLGIDEIRVFDIDRAAMLKFAEHMSAYPTLRVILADSALAAVKDSDIVTTVTADKAWATILTADMIEPGMHINAIGGDCPGKTELHMDVLLQSDIFVEYEPQSRIEGDIQQLPAAHPVTELWQVITGRATGRISDQQITVFDSVGFALEDFSALRYVNKLATELGYGTQLNLVPELPDSKDLFTLTTAGQVARDDLAAA